MFWNGYYYCSRLSVCARPSFLNPFATLRPLDHKNRIHPLQRSSYKYSYSNGKWSSVIYHKYHNIHSSSRQCFHEDSQTKSLTIFNSVKQVKNSPRAALVLSICGAVPFVAAPMYLISKGIYLPCLAFAQLAYGASILSFIGGIRLGLTLPEGSTQSPDWHNLGYSIVPPLVAWAGIFASSTIGSLIVMSGLALTGYMDIAMWGYPNWFKGLRFCITFIAILSLWTTLMCKYILAQKPSVNKGALDSSEIS